MAKQKQTLYVNGRAVAPRNHTRRNTFLIMCLLCWCGFITVAYYNLKQDVRSNSLSIDKAEVANHAEYMRILSQRESGKDYSIIGGSNNHYLGAFQFGRVAMKDIGLIDTRRDYREFRRKFIADGVEFWTVEQQQQACMALMRKNTHYMRNHTQYVGRTINGTKVTQAGILAACHLVGHRAVKDWLESNGANEARDGFNTSLVEYMELMVNVK